MGLNIFVDSVDVRVSYHTIPVLQDGKIIQKRNESYRWTVPIVLDGYNQLVDLEDGRKALVRPGGSLALSTFEPYAGPQPSSKVQILADLVPGTAGRGCYSLSSGNQPHHVDWLGDEQYVTLYGWFQHSDIPVRIHGIYTWVDRPGVPMLVKIELLGTFRDIAARFVLVDIKDLKLFLFPLTNGFRLLPRSHRFYLPFPFRSLTVGPTKRLKSIRCIRRNGIVWAYQKELTCVPISELKKTSPWFNQCLGDDFVQVNHYDGRGIDHCFNPDEEAIYFTMPDRPVFVSMNLNQVTYYAMVFPNGTLFSPLIEVIAAGFLTYKGEDKDLKSFVNILSSLPPSAAGEIFSRVLKEPFNAYESMMRWLLDDVQPWHNQGPYMVNATVFTKDVSDIRFSSWLSPDNFIVATVKGTLKFSWQALVKSFYITPTAVLGNYFSILFPVGNFSRQSNVPVEYFNALRGRIDFMITSQPLTKLGLLRESTMVYPSLELLPGFDQKMKLNTHSVLPVPTGVVVMGSIANNYQFQKYVSDTIIKGGKSVLCIESTITGLVPGPYSWIFDIVLDEVQKTERKTTYYYQYIVQVDDKGCGLGKVVYSFKKSPCGMSLVVPLLAFKYLV